jgi:hypothetical protein
VGLLVAASWGLYFATRDIPIEPIVRALSLLTQPAAAIVLYLDPHARLGLTTVILENAATYALIGSILEVFRRRYLRLQI